MAVPRIVSDEPSTADDWDRAWRATSHATYFESRQWAEIWARTTSDRLRPAARSLTFEDGVVAIVPGSDDIRAGGLLRIRRMSPADTYGGWLSEGEFTRRHVDAVVQWVTATTNVRWLVNPFAAKAIGRSVIPGAGTWTLAIDLADGFTAVVARWSTTHKRNAAKAQRSDIDVMVAETELDWAAYYRVYELSLDRWGSSATSRYPWRLFSELARESDGVRLWIARVDGEVVAGVLCLLGPQITSYWHGAADARFFPLRPSNLLLQEAIRGACDDGFRWFDLGPSGGLEGVERFKTGFGPVRMDVPVLDRSSVPVRSIRSMRRAIRSSRVSGATLR